MTPTESKRVAEDIEQYADLRFSHRRNVAVFFGLMGVGLMGLWVVAEGVAWAAHRVAGWMR